MRIEEPQATRKKMAKRKKSAFVWYRMVPSPGISPMHEDTSNDKRYYRGHQLSTCKTQNIRYHTRHYNRERDTSIDHIKEGGWNWIREGSRIMGIFGFSTCFLEIFIGNNARKLLFNCCLDLRLVLLDELLQSASPYYLIFNKGTSYTIFPPLCLLSWFSSLILSTCVKSIYYVVGRCSKWYIPQNGCRKQFNCRNIRRKEDSMMMWWTIWDNEFTHSSFSSFISCSNYLCLYAKIFSSTLCKEITW